MKNPAEDKKSKVSAISLDRLERIVNGGEDWFLLDVRNDIDYERWKIEGKKTPETINIPYFDFFDNEDEQIRKIPKDKPVLVVCAKGDSSEFVADILNQKGMKASNLKGGIVAWGDYYNHRPVPGYGDPAAGDLLLQINRVAKGCLSYMLISGGEAVVVDASRHIRTYLDMAREHRAVITRVLDTHLHADHISGGPALAQEAGAEYYIQKADTGDAPLRHIPLLDGDVFRIGKSSVEVMAHLLPGHTPGSTSFLVDHKFLLSGDTLFVHGVGRPDLGGKVEEWARMLYDSLFRKLSRYAEDLVVLPTHYAGPSEVDDQGLVMGSLAKLRKDNPALQAESEEAFVRYIKSRIKSQPAIYQDIRLVNLREKEIDEETASEMELGKNECAAAPH